MTAPSRRYLDNAATSWPKPESVFAAWERAAREIGAAAGRGSSREVMEAGRIIARARSLAAEMLGGVEPGRVAFPAGGTLALNIAIHGLLRPGDHAVATAADHNATLRPLQWLARHGGIALDIVPCDDRGVVDPDAVARSLRPTTRLVTCVHASNVTGAVQDAATIADLAHRHGAVMLLDAAQTLGHWSRDAMAAIGADMIAAPAHKWLLGPMGAGLLFVRPGLEVAPLVQGGTGSASDSLDMPEAFPERMEAGTPDLPAIAGMAAAIEWLMAETVEAVAVRCRMLADACAARLGEVGGVRVVGGDRSGGHAPIVSFLVEGYDPADVAMMLEQVAGVQCRAGFHCAARVHEHLGTTAGGTVRASFGPFNAADDVDALVATVATLSQG